MKLSKEVWLVVATVAFLLAWLIDRLAGPVVITVGNPIAFLRSSVILQRYPFTATAIIIRAFGLFVTSMLVITSILERQYFAKAVALFFIGILAEFYAIQQLANGFKLTTIQWTLSLAYGSIALVGGIAWLILKGIWWSFNKEKGTGTNGGSENSVLEPSNK